MAYGSGSIREAWITIAVDAARPWWRSLHALLAVVLLFFPAGSPAQAQQATADLFSTPPAPTAAGPHGLEALQGLINASSVERGLGRLHIQLPGGNTVEIARDGFERRKDGDVTWRGRITGDDGSRVVLTAKNGYIAGRILHGLDEYRIRPGLGRSHVIERINSAISPGDEHLDPAIDYSIGINPYYSPSPLPPPPTGNSPDNIQLLVVYTPQALAAAGGTPQIEVRIQSMVDEVNTAFIDSGMIARVALVQTVEVDYTESGDILIDFFWVTSAIDAMQVTANRFFYGADLVSLIVDNGGQCAGAAYVMNIPDHEFMAYAYSASALSCGGAGLAHEIGHNMGFEHNPENSARWGGTIDPLTGQDNTPSYPFSFGHYVDGAFHTIMSYESPCLSGCPMALQFSNPDISLLGFPTGVLDERDNAQTGDLTAPIVADFLDAVTGNLVNRRVSASVEDVEELADGTVVTASTTLELGDGLSGVTAVGLRFQDLNIPPGMRIDSAYLEFEAADVGTVPTSVSIRAEAADNTAPFSTAPFDVTGRPETLASVQWDLAAWDSVTEKHYTPDISSVIQEVVDRPGWVENNSIVVTVSGTGLRSALAYDGGPMSAPLLHVEYASPDRPASISVPVAAFGYSCAGLTCSFTDESTDSDGTVVQWSWFFGYPLSVSSFEQNPTVTFPADGIYSVSLEVSDDQGWPGRVEKQIQIHAVNTPPVATSNAYTTGPDVPLNGNVLTDGTPDSDADGDPLAVVANTGPLNGMVTVAGNGAFTYTPVAGFSGADSFDYTIGDSNGGSATATVTVTVGAPVNRVPVATDNSYATNEDVAVSGNVLTDGTPDSDPDGDALTVTANTSPLNGAVTVAGTGAFTYTPNADFWGSDSFTYTVSDGNGGTATATVNIAIAAVNDAPQVAFSPACNGLNCTFSGNMTDVDNVVNFTVKWDFGDGSVHSTTTVGNIVHGYVADGTYTVTLSVTDSDGATGTASQSVAVSNNPPTAHDKSYQTWSVALGGNMIAGTVSGGTGLAIYSPADSDPDGDPVAVVSNTNPSHGTLTVWDTAGNFEYKPASGFYGYDSFAYTVGDGHGATATATVNITVNESPSASFTASCTGRTCAFADTSRDNLGPISEWNWSFGDGSVSTAQNPSHTYAAEDFYTVTLVVTDALGFTSTETQSVWATNAAPTATDNVYVTNEDSLLTGDVLTDGTPDSDPDGDVLTVTANTNPLNGAVSVAANGTFTYTPNPDFNGADSFTYTVSDGTDVSTAVVTITVNPVNDTPVASFSHDCAGLNCTFTDGSADVEGAIASWSWDFGDGATSAAQNPAHSYSADGSYTVTLTVTDADDATGSATQSVTVANTAPVATDNAYTTDEDVAVSGNFLTDGVPDSDPDGDPLILIDTAPLPGGVIRGTLSVNADGSFTYTPAANFSGTDGFRYSIGDPYGGSAIGTVTITVNPVNDAPAATFVDACLGLNCDFTDGSTDVEGPIATWSWDFGDGTASPLQNPLHRYAADGTYAVSLTVSDGQGATATTTRQIAVANTPPLASANSYVLDEDTSVSGNVLTDGVPDSDPDGDPISIVANGSPASGTVILGADGAFNYTPIADFNGTDSFTYTMSDGIASTTAAVTLTVNPVNDGPVAGFVPACTDLDCTFTDASTDIDGTIAAWSWDFGDGATSVLQSPAHSYAAVDGTYTVSLTVTDDQGAADTTTATVTIVNPFPPSAPADLAATVVSNGNGANMTMSVTLTWTDTAINEASFVVERCEVQRGRNSSICVFGVVAEIGPNLTKYSEDIPGGTYRYRVKARNRNGDSPYSNEALIDPKA